jgi:hypothetical protein
MITNSGGAVGRLIDELAWLSDDPLKAETSQAEADEKI